MKAIDEKMNGSDGKSAGQLDDVADFLEQARSLKTGYISAHKHERRDFLKEATSNRFVDGKNVEIQWHPPYEALAKRPDFNCCDHVRERPRTVETFIEKLIGTMSPTSLPS